MSREDFKAELECLKAMPAGVDRDMQLFKWKHKHWDKQKIFSTLHGGDCTGNLIKVLSNDLVWEDTCEIEGKKIILEYERNFNEFVKWLQQ